MYKGKMYVPNYSELENTLMREMHNVPYARHQGYQKTIAVVRSQYFWPKMKKEVANYMAICLECQKVKIENRHPSRMLHPLAIP
jgi:hypothetical protein